MILNAKIQCSVPTRQEANDGYDSEVEAVVKTITDQILAQIK